MSHNHDSANLAVYALLEVELQVDTHDNLGNQHEHDNRNKLGVHIVFGKLPPFVLVTQEVANDCEDGAGNLYGNMPFRANYLSTVSVLVVSRQCSSLTPRTIPVGKMSPHASPCNSMCVHRMESIGSSDTASPCAILFT